MKIISLNVRVWRMFENLSEFIAEHRDSTDVFCFQEVFHTLWDNVIIDEYYRADIYNRLCEMLPDHQAYYSPYAVWGFLSPVDFHVERGNAIFAKRDIWIKSTWVEYFFWAYATAHDLEEHNVKNFQHITVDYQWKELCIMNLHGIRELAGKSDSPKRLQQSKELRDFINKTWKSTILVWDFNLDPDTQSMDILREWMNDLITEYDISTTRSKLYRNYWEHLFADYALLSPDIVVKSFEVPYSEASDHLPLILEIE